jgi:hypothetical protein
MAQPILRGVQAVGNVNIRYRYNSADGVLVVPKGWGADSALKDQVKNIDTNNWVLVAGLRLDGEFIRAAQQIASSVVIPILGGGGIALTNNNRTGSLSINCTRAGSPNHSTAAMAIGEASNGGLGPGIEGSDPAYYDMSLLAQYQQMQPGGDPFGSSLKVEFDFSGIGIEIQFDGCTVQTVAPLVLSGNDASNYNVVFNYLNWKCGVSDSTIATDTDSAQ